MSEIRFPAWVKRASFGAAVVIFFGSVGLGRWAGGDAQEVIAWLTAAWIAGQGILTVANVAFDEDATLKQSWEMLTKPVIGLVGMGIFGYAIGTAWRANNTAVLSGVLALVTVLFVIAKWIQAWIRSTATEGAATPSSASSAQS